MGKVNFVAKWHALIKRQQVTYPAPQWQGIAPCQLSYMVENSKSLTASGHAIDNQFKVLEERSFQNERAEPPAQLFKICSHFPATVYLGFSIFQKRIHILEFFYVSSAKYLG